MSPDVLFVCAGRADGGLGRPDVWRRWLPTWLPTTLAAPALFDSSNLIANSAASAEAWLRWLLAILPSARDVEPSVRPPRAGATSEAPAALDCTSCVDEPAEEPLVAKWAGGCLWHPAR
jgi:hypothetical protein